MQPPQSQQKNQQKTIMLMGNALGMLLNFRKALIADLHARGYHVVVVAPKDVDADAQFKQLDVTYIPLALNRWGTNPIADLRSIFQMYHLLRTVHPDLLITYTIKPNLYALPLAKLLGIKSIGAVTGLGYVFLNDTVVARLARGALLKSLGSARHVLFLNAADQKQICAQSKTLAAKSSLLPGEGIDIAHFAPQEPPKKPFRFLMIARLLTDKGFHEYVKAARIVASTNPDVEFQILGPMDAHNPSAISQAQLNDAIKAPNITYLGNASDPRPHIAQSHCVVLPSYREGISRVLLEAGAMARPSIATNVPGCNDIVVEGKTGLLCQPKSPQSLAETMQRFIELDDQNRGQMGQNARLHIHANFSDEVVLKTYHDIFERLDV